MNNIDINRIVYFVRIVEAGNITSASKVLNEPKAKLSRNLSLLEEELGVQLVYRTTRQFKLTEVGFDFYQQAKENVEGILQSISLLQNQDEQLSGKIKITAPDDLGLYVVTKIVDEFARLHPQVSFELIYTNEMLDLVREGIDVAIRVGKLKDSSLIQKKIGSIEFILVASPRYLKKTITSVDELNRHQTIGFLNREWILQNKAKQHRLKLKHKMISNNLIAARDLALQGHGIAYLPRFVCQEYLKSGELIHVLKLWGDHGPSIQVMTPHQKKVSKKVRAFYDHAAERIAEIF